MIILILIPSVIIILSLWLVRLNRDYALSSFTRKIKTIDGSPLDDKASVVGGFWGSNFDLLSMSLGKCLRYQIEHSISFISFRLFKNKFFTILGHLRSPSNVVIFNISSCAPFIMLWMPAMLNWF